MAQFTFGAIGTSWKIDIYDVIEEDRALKVLAAVKQRIDMFDKVYSRFRADSLVTFMSQKTGTYELPPDAEPMMSLYHDLYKRTGGYVTPLIGRLISDAGYDATYSLQPKSVLLPAPSWDEAIEYIPPKLIVKKPVLLDFGAAGKGYLIDLVADVLLANSIASYLINAGGDILYKNETAATVGLEDPDDETKVVGTCTLSGGSVCGSAGNRRRWGNFTHIMNPKTMSSPKDTSAVWVTARTALLADALTTCLFFVKPRALQGYEFEYVIMRNDRSIEKSPGFSGELYM